MGCGASTATPPEAKYAVSSEPPPIAQKPAGTSAAAASSIAAASTPTGTASDRDIIRFDVFLSHNTESQETAARVNDWLVESGYRSIIDDNKLDLALDSAVQQQRANVSAAKFFVAFLSEAYFTTVESCLELCEAVSQGVPIVLVVVDGSLWNGKRFPALTDVPEEHTLGDGSKLRTRDAAGAAFASAVKLEHTRSYFDAFLAQLKAALGPPPEGQVSSVEAHAMVRSRRFYTCDLPCCLAASPEQPVLRIWRARTWLRPRQRPDRTRRNSHQWSAVRGARLQVSHPRRPASPTLFASSYLLSQIRDRVASASVTAEPGGEKVVPVVAHDSAGATHDAGVTLVGPQTMLSEVRSQIIEANEEEEGDADGDAEEDPAAKLLGAGTFSFMRSDGTLVEAEQEAGVVASELGDPINVKVTG